MRDFPDIGIESAFRRRTDDFERAAAQRPRAAVTASKLAASLHFNDFDPISALANRKARRLAKFSAGLIDPIDRQPIRFFTGSDEIASAGVDIDAARLPFGGKMCAVQP